MLSFVTPVNQGAIKKFGINSDEREVRIKILASLLPGLLILL
jgi:hypothetical protein